MPSRLLFVPCSVAKLPSAPGSKTSERLLPFRQRRCPHVPGSTDAPVYSARGSEMAALPGLVVYCSSDESTTVSFELDCGRRGSGSRSGWACSRSVGGYRSRFDSDRSANLRAVSRTHQSLGRGRVVRGTDSRNGFRGTRFRDVLDFVRGPRGGGSRGRGVLEREEERSTAGGRWACGHPAASDLRRERADV